VVPLAAIRGEKGDVPGHLSAHLRLGLWIALGHEDFPGLAALVRPDGSVAARLTGWHPGVLTGHPSPNKSAPFPR
jgi:hypothetical protein